MTNATEVLSSANTTQVLHLAAGHTWLALKALTQVPLSYKFRKKILPVYLILRALGKLMYLVKSSQENCLPAFCVKKRTVFSSWLLSQAALQNINNNTDEEHGTNQVKISGYLLPS